MQALHNHPDFDMAHPSKRRGRVTTVHSTARKISVRRQIAALREKAVKRRLLLRKLRASVITQHLPKMRFRPSRGKHR